MTLAEAARVEPFRLAHNHPYNCHMAVIHWALMATGRSQEDAHDAVEELIREYCLHCRGEHDNKASLDNERYGQMFCKQAKLLEPDKCAPGDVLILPSLKWPSHSMVVVETQGGISIRGFNNTGTFGDSDAPRGKYDNQDRSLGTKTAEGDVLRIPQLTFLDLASALPFPQHFSGCCHLQ